MGSVRNNQDCALATHQSEMTGEVINMIIKFDPIGDKQKVWERLWCMVYMCGLITGSLGNNTCIAFIYSEKRDKKDFAGFHVKCGSEISIMYLDYCSYMLWYLCKIVIQPLETNLL